jgi:hypothetical protein
MTSCHRSWGVIPARVWRARATVLEVKLESGVVSLRVGSPSRVRALAHAGFATLDGGRRSGLEVHLGVAGAASLHANCAGMP